MNHSKHPLILLFGMPRSGTTWIGKIFDSHPDTLYRHEPDSRFSQDTVPLFAHKSEAEQYRAFVEDYVEELPGIREEKISASLPIFPKHYYSTPAFAVRKLLVYGSKIASRALGPIAPPDIINYGCRPEIAVVWKSIESLGRLGIYTTLFPDARAIAILRHPCGYVASVLRGERKGKFESTTRSSEDWGIYELLSHLPTAKDRGLDLAIMKSMSPIQRLALRWAIYNEHALLETRELENVLPVRYEDFCEHPLEETQKAFRHCNLSWHSQTEHFIAQSTSREKGEYYSVFKDPKIAAAKWKQELSPNEIREVMATVSGFSASAYYPDSV